WPVFQRADLPLDDPLEAALDLLILDVAQVALENREDLAALRDPVEDRTPLVLHRAHLLAELGDARARVAHVLRAAVRVEVLAPEDVGGPELIEAVGQRADVLGQTILLT